LANVSRSYSKNNTGTVFLRHRVVTILLCIIYIKYGKEKAAEFFIRQEALTSSDIIYYLLYSRYMMTSVTSVTVLLQRISYFIFIFFNEIMNY